jgi:hypothetical protein
LARNAGLAGAPVYGLYVIREDDSFDGESARKGDLERIAFRLGGDRARDQQPDFLVNRHPD